MPRLKSMYQREEETNSNWLFHPNQWRLVEEALSGTSILYAPDATSSDVQADVCILLVLQTKTQSLCIYVHMRACRYM